MGDEEKMEESPPFACKEDDPQQQAPLARNTNSIFSNFDDW